PDYPDDLQVLVHDGGPRITENPPELIWVRVIDSDHDIFVGTILNQPHQLESVTQASQIRFIVPDGGEYPLLVTPKYLQERPDWIVQPCNKCGLAELFDAPSDLKRVVFPNVSNGEVMLMFTAFCGACGGVQIVQHKDFQPDETDSQTQSKKWWQFWKR
ncbi:MAG: hypothetical protein GY847_10205, partial [Proteobacteria bacterium]|nr:hypothetical protein [Pseudomonadota bacterium]